MARTLKTWRPRYDLVTTFVVALLVLVWLGTGIHGWWLTGSARALVQPSAALLERWGAPRDPVLWRAVLANVLHAGLGHLYLNLTVLPSVSAPLERGVHPLVPLPLFVLGGTAGLLASRYLAGVVPGFFGVLLTGGPVPVVGASAGVCAVAGGLFESCMSDGEDEMARPVALWASKLLVLGLVVNATGLLRFDNAGHLGGFVAGVVLMRVLSRGGRAVLLALLAASLGLSGYALWRLVHG